jgi:TonB family protein
MRFRRFITKVKGKSAGEKPIRFVAFSFRLFSKFKGNFIFSISLLLLAVYCLPIFAAAPKIAVIVPEKNVETGKFAEKLKTSLSAKFNVLDESLSETAFRSGAFENPFNLSVEDAKNAGAAIGGDYFLLVKSDSLRRSAFQREEYYEAFAPVFVVSSKTGRLVFWKLQIFESDKRAEAEKLLLDSTHNLSLEIFEKLKIVSKEELNEKISYKIEEVPETTSPESKNLRPPLPYKRFKPEYTRLAYIYDVTATVDVLVDLDEKGAILRAEIVRWAGYGLDESVVETVRKMNWRPAERAGKALPMRVLLRYNFKRIEKEED